LLPSPTHHIRAILDLHPRLAHLLDGGGRSDARQQFLVPGTHNSGNVFDPHDPLARVLAGLVR
jgi:hypothetical protein